MLAKHSVSTMFKSTCDTDLKVSAVRWFLHEVVFSSIVGRSSIKDPMIVPWSGQLQEELQEQRCRKC